MQNYTLDFSIVLIKYTRMKGSEVFIKDSMLNGQEWVPFNLWCGKGSGKGLECKVFDEIDIKFNISIIKGY